MPSLGSYDYDLLVIGGGSGGLAVAKVSTILTLLFGEVVFCSLSFYEALKSRVDRQHKSILLHKYSLMHSV